MKVFWAPQAERDRADIWDHIALDSPSAAARIDLLFSEAAASLARFSERGRPGIGPGTRELQPHESYRLIYEVNGDDVWVLALIHSARHWPPFRDRPHIP